MESPRAARPRCAAARTGGAPSTLALVAVVSLACGSTAIASTAIAQRREGPAPDAAPSVEAALDEPSVEAAPEQAPSERVAPADAAPVDAAPVDAAPVDAAPADAAPVDAAPADAAPVDAAPVDAAPIDAAPEQAPPVEPTSEHAALEDPAVTAPEESEHDWLDDLHIGVFADGYAQAIWTLPEPFGGDESAVIGHRPFTHIGGITLSFVGVDVEYRADAVGATLQLRWGTSVPRLLGPTSGLPDGMQFLKQAFVSWRPFERAQIDFGQFDTIFGAEVSESWQNHNYSRGALYNLVQPFYHTGFRLAYAPVENVTVTGLAVNGWNNVVDNNDMKTFGLQVAYASGPITISGGYLGGPEGDADDDHWRHLADVVATLEVEDFELAANADYVAEDLGGGVYDQLWGVMISGRLRFPPHVALALRGEYIGDPDDDSGLVTGTFTIEVTPVENLIIRLDNRLDVSTEDTFQSPDGLPSPTVFSTILGVVVRST